MGHKWTDEEDASLRAMYMEGVTCSVIGERLGMTKNAIVGRSHRLGLTRKDQIKLAEDEARQRRLEKRRERDAALRAKHRAKAAAVKEAAAKADKGRPLRAKVAQPPSFPIESYVPKRKPPLPLAALKQGQCRWPVNNPPRGGEFLFCGGQAECWPYCPEHTKIAFRGLHN